MNQERKSMKDQSLVGMFVPLDGHDDYRTGCIVAAVGLGQCLLIQWDKMSLACVFVWLKREPLDVRRLTKA
jgi:hypothetical protein